MSFEQPSSPSSTHEGKDLHPSFRRFYRVEKGQNDLDHLLNLINASPEWLDELSDETIPQVRSIVEMYTEGNKEEAQQLMKKLLS